MRLLFERLVNPQLPIEDIPQQQITLVKESIRAELRRIASGRSYFAGGDENEERYLLNYGLMDLVSRAATQSEYIQVAKELEQNISQFEPRLMDVAVTVVPGDKDSRYRLKLTGKYKNFEQTKILTFFLGSDTADIE
ncbi:type VI secretion system baseplate subunit TssE [Aliikangiella coralliicola]|uniref:Type VI secretion system baseplate subunit TssE n=1 Tax=Aliikangiella coralliicola TaxID=2592383 RepID=A0A545UCT0_9GAMM|nr:type VI secretion system baseplate subunit TssE [Aliikangiella coralliicola]TQV87268.1 type VI secretion system baseplate subunit TssE [Aliikangiella coralliicola]